MRNAPEDNLRGVHARLAYQEVPAMRRLLDDLGHTTGADGVAAFADCEGEALFHGDRLDQLDREGRVIARLDPVSYTHLTLPTICSV